MVFSRMFDFFCRISILSKIYDISSNFKPFSKTSCLSFRRNFYKNSYGNSCKNFSVSTLKESSEFLRIPLEIIQEAETSSTSSKNSPGALWVAHREIFQAFLRRIFQLILQKVFNECLQEFLRVLLRFI